MSLKIHHLDCGSFCPHFSQTLFGVSHFSCHCLLVETPKNLILVDTGLSELFLKLNKNPAHQFLTRPKFTAADSAKAQVQKLGYNISDVTDIIATHVDQDHIGAVHEFKSARLHLHNNELEHLNSQQQGGVQRFSSEYTRNTKEMITYTEFGEDWFGFKSVKQMSYLPPEILLVPLVGHTSGHSGVALRLNEGWLLHAGDAYFFKEDMNLDNTEKNFKGEIFQSFDAIHNLNRLKNQKRLAELHRDYKNIQIINSHDPRYLKNYSNKN